MSIVEQEVSSRSLFALADQLAALRTRKANLEESLKDTNNQIAHVEQQMVEAMRIEDVTNFKKDGRTFYMTSRTWARPAEGQEEALLEQLRADGLGDMIKTSVNTQTLSAWVSRLQEDDPETFERYRPLLQLTPTTGIGIRSK